MKQIISLLGDQLGNQSLFEWTPSTFLCWNASLDGKEFLSPSLCLCGSTRK